MDNHLHNDKDGLEDFFRDRLFDYKDEPGLGMWDRIEGAIPEKPKKNFKPFFIWAGRAVAACIILSLGFFNYQYRNQLNHVADQLKDSENSMASLEQRLNDIYENQNDVVAVVENESNTALVNTNPRIKEITKYYPQIVYLPTETSDRQRNEVVQVAEPKVVIKNSPKVTRNAPQTTTKQKKVNREMAMAFAQNHYNQVDKKDILDLNKKVLKGKNAIQIDANNIQMPGSKFVLKKGKWGVGNNTGIVSSIPASNVEFKDHEIDSVMKSLAFNNNRLRDVNLDKVVGVGANYSINNNISVFMAPDIMENLKKSNRTLNTNNLYPYQLGIESGVTYHF